MVITNCWIWCLCQDQFGNLIGRNYPSEIIISNYFEMFENYIYKQERFVAPEQNYSKNIFLI